jgi:hypothetical protein
VGQAQAVAEFQLGRVEVGLEPVEGVLAELPGAQGVGQRPGDDRAGLQDGLVVGQDDGVEAVKVELADLGAAGAAPPDGG